MTQHYKTKKHKIINSLIIILIVACLVVLLQLDIDNAINWLKNIFK